MRLILTTGITERRHPCVASHDAQGWPVAPQSETQPDSGAAIGKPGWAIGSHRWLSSLAAKIFYGGQAMVRRLISSRNFFRRGERALPSVETDKVDHLVIDGHDLPGWTTGTTLLKTVTEPLTIVEPPKVIGAVIRDDAPTLPRRLDRWE